MARAGQKFQRDDSVWAWRRQILRSNLPAETRHVLLTVACHMRDNSQECYTSPRDLSSDTGLARGTVVQRLREAVEDGWITVTTVETRYLHITRKYTQ